MRKIKTLHLPSFFSTDLFHTPDTAPYHYSSKTTGYLWGWWEYNDLYSLNSLYTAWYFENLCFQLKKINKTKLLEWNSNFMSKIQSRLTKIHMNRLFILNDDAFVWNFWQRIWNVLWQSLFSRMLGVLTTSTESFSLFPRTIWAPNLSKKMGEFGGQNAHSTLNTDCKSGV